MYAIDEKNENTIWKHAIQREMVNVKITFQTIPEGKNQPDGFQYDNCHIVFDIKMEDFQRKACLVVEVHITHILNNIT